MSAVIAIRNATQMLTAEEHEHISGLIDNLKSRAKDLKSQVKELNSANVKRTSLLNKIREIHPDFTDKDESYDDLKIVYENAKQMKAEALKQHKRRERLVKKWNDADFLGDCPDMDNDALDNHIKDLLTKQRQEKSALKKSQNKLKAIENKRNKLFDKLTQFGLSPDNDSTFEELQTILEQHNNSEKERKKELALRTKFRKQLDDIYSKNPDIPITSLPTDASSEFIQNVVIQARNARDEFKKNAKKLEQQKKAQERADKIAAEKKKKSDEKAKKAADKQAGIKGTNKNSYFQAFTAHITQQISDGEISQSDIDDAGGKCKYNSKQWAEMTDLQKKDPNAPWNRIQV